MLLKLDALSCARTLRVAFAIAAASAIWLLPAATSRAALTNVGSSLSQTATTDTAQNLNYVGTDTAVGPTAEHPRGAVIHTYHYGADMALWNTALGGAGASMPADGQAVQIRLKGCAVPAPGGPAPLTEIHFQTLSPAGGGSMRVVLSSQPFDIPVCGHGGASGATVSTYTPVNLCVRRGDAVAFNDEGGFVEHAYQSGVPYRVLAPAPGSSFNSFIRGNGTNNGALFSPLDRTNMDGFATNPGQELLMQVVLGTGANARYVCPGGSKDAPPVLSALSVHRQTAGVGRKRVVAVTIYCRPPAGCAGNAALTVGAKRLNVGKVAFNLQGNHSTSVPIHVSSKLLSLTRRARSHRVAATLTASTGSTTVAGPITVKLNSSRRLLGGYSRR